MSVRSNMSNLDTMTAGRLDREKRNDSKGGSNVSNMSNLFPIEICNTQQCGGGHAHNMLKYKHRHCNYVVVCIPHKKTSWSGWTGWTEPIITAIYPVFVCWTDVGLRLDRSGAAPRRVIKTYTNILQNRNRKGNKGGKITPLGKSNPHFAHTASFCSKSTSGRKEHPCETAGSTAPSMPLQHRSPRNPVKLNPHFAQIPAPWAFSPAPEMGSDRGFRAENLRSSQCLISRKHSKPNSFYDSRPHHGLMNTCSRPTPGGALTVLSDRLREHSLICNITRILSTAYSRYRNQI